MITGCMAREWRITLGIGKEHCLSTLNIWKGEGGTLAIESKQGRLSTAMGEERLWRSQGRLYRNVKVKLKAD